jgi:hypothetical protein
MSEDESRYSPKEKTVLKDPNIRQKYEDFIQKGKMKEAEAYLAFEVNILDIHENFFKKGKFVKNNTLFLLISAKKTPIHFSH